MSIVKEQIKQINRLSKLINNFIMSITPKETEDAPSKASHTSDRFGPLIETVAKQQKEFQIL